MITINQNYIADNFSLPGTNILVLLNGVYQPELSSQPNKSMLKGKTLRIPKNTQVEIPIHLLFLTSQNCQHSLDIIAEEGSYTTIIEEHASFGNEPYASDIKIHITTEANSEIDHYKLQSEEISQSIHQTNVVINQAKNSKITSNFISNGAKIAIDTLHVKLAGKNASYNMQGINFLHNKQEMSNQIRIEHLEPNCSSNIVAKSIVDDQAINNFDCRVVAHSGATKTETHVTNKNLLLSKHATANTAPELEVYVDDVICTHGATVGQLDKDALFYLRSRGIAENMAIKILVSAFVQEITESFLQYDRYKFITGLAHD